MTKFNNSFVVKNIHRIKSKFDSFIHSLEIDLDSYYKRRLKSEGVNINNTFGSVNRITVDYSNDFSSIHIKYNPVTFRNKGQSFEAFNIIVIDIINETIKITNMYDVINNYNKDINEIKEEIIQYSHINREAYDGKIDYEERSAHNPILALIGRSQYKRDLKEIEYTNERIKSLNEELKDAKNDNLIINNEDIIHNLTEIVMQKFSNEIAVRLNGPYRYTEKG